jgi:DNA-binding NtrC family response regulator
MRILIDYAWPGNVRELRNLVESMVVVAPGRVIRPEDIPSEVREGGRRGSLLPVLAARPQPHPAEARPEELDFVLRTIFDLRLDVEDLRREFDRFRREREPYLQFRELEIPQPFPPAFGATERPRPDAEEEGEQPPIADDAEMIVFREGMTMEDLERRAIEVALRRVGGNRRRAADALGIGERTLYRKIKEYELG